MAVPTWRDVQLKNISVNPDAALNVSAGAASNLLKGVAERKRLSFAKDKLLSDELHRDRLQDWSEGEQQRDVDFRSGRAKSYKLLEDQFLEQSRANIVDQDTVEFQQGLNASPKVLGNGNRLAGPELTGSSNFRIDDYAPAIQNVQKLADQANAETRANPSLFVDPNEMQRTITQQMREQGFKDENIKPLLGSFTDQYFPTASPELAQEVIKGINAEKTAAELFGDKFVSDAKSGNFGTESGSKSKSAVGEHRDFNSVDDYLKARKFKEGSEGFFDNWISNKVYEDDIRKYTTRMANARISPPIALSLLDGMIENKELKQEQFLSDENFGKLLAAAQIRKGAMASSGGGSGGQVGNPKDLVALLEAGRADKNDRIQQALNSTRMNMVTPEMRKNALFSPESLASIGITTPGQPTGPAFTAPVSNSGESGTNTGGNVNENEGSIDEQMASILGVSGQVNNPLTNSIFPEVTPSTIDTHPESSALTQMDMDAENANTLRRMKEIGSMGLGVGDNPEQYNSYYQRQIDKGRVPGTRAAELNAENVAATEKFQSLDGIKSMLTTNTSKNIGVLRKALAIADRSNNPELVKQIQKLVRETRRNPTTGSSKIFEDSNQASMFSGF